MARGKPLTREALAAVGADVLAEVLIAHAGTDPVLRKKLGMLLAGTEGPDRLAAEIDKRIRTIGRSRSFVSWEQRLPLLHELDHLRETIATGLAGQDRERAIELLWNLIGIAAAVTDRMPVVLEPEDWPVWLGETTGNPIVSLHPPAEEILQCWPISTRVNSPKNNDAMLLDPVTRS